MKTGPGDEAEAAALEDARPGDVGRQQVGRALDPVRLEVERPGDRPGEERLAGARDVLDEDVAVGEQRDRDEPERLVGADDGLADRPPEVVPERAGRDGDDVRRRGSRAGRPIADRSASAPASIRRQASAARRRRTAGRMPPCS